jgi:hypothetical protein
MEGLTRLVSESLVRHGLDRPVDYRRLRWSRWFRCESHHSLLQVPSKPGVFALAEEIMDFGPAETHVGTAARGEPGSAAPVGDRVSDMVERSEAPPASALEGIESAPTHRMLAVTQFFEDDDMAFVLDRMLTPHHPMRARLASGRHFVRFVIIEDSIQRRSICQALEQWLTDSADKASAIGSHFAASLDLTPSAGRFEGGRALSATAGAQASLAQGDQSDSGPIAGNAAPSQLDSGAAANIHCPPPFPFGF